MAQGSIRSFLAIELSEALKAEAWKFIESLKPQCSGFKFIPSDNWHLTLHFFGALEPSQIEKLKTHVPDALRAHRPFSLGLEGFGAFPNFGKPRILWVGAGGDLPAISTLKRNLDQILKKMNFQIESRPYQAHLTVARAKQGIGKVAATRHDFKSETMDHIRHLTLFRSDLSPQGTSYTALEKFELGLA